MDSIVNFAGHSRKQKKTILQSTQMSALKLPSPIMSISSSDLFDLIRSHCGQEILDIVTAQKIPDIKTLLRVNDLFTLIHLPTDEFRELKEKVAVPLHDGTWSVLIGFQARVDELMDAFREQARVDEHEYYSSSDTMSSPDHLTLSIDLLDKFPSLSTLIELCTELHTLSDRKDLSSLIEILNNICFNLTRSQNNFQYSNYIIQFAISLFIYSGQNAYRFVSLNVPGFLPSITTIKKRLHNSSFRMYEARFRFDAMRDYFAASKCVFAFAVEDCTGVITKVTYDSMSNSFVGFITPLAYGQPLPDQHRTNSYAELQTWFEEKRKSSFINVHTLQPLHTTSSDRTSSPFLLSAYGVDGTYTAEDVFSRWIWLYEEAKRKGIRIIGFSTDCDARYLRSMRIASDFFASHIDHTFKNHADAFRINIPSHWHWFNLQSPQLCLFIQDGIHLCTKLRNRLLSKTACLLFGDEIISNIILTHLISTTSKIRHGLVYSDVRPRDRQNFSSCQKICHEDVFELLKTMHGVIPNTNGIYVYLRLIECTILAYCEKSISLTDRLHYAWLSVFICRFWRAWLGTQVKQTLSETFSTQFATLLTSLPSQSHTNILTPNSSKKRTKRNFTITNPSLFSIEINAHSLTYLVLLAIDGQLPFDVLTVPLLSSQSCESVFRTARAMSGASSNIVNFTVLDFLRRADKISALQSIKTEHEHSSSLRFPKHHKHGRVASDSSSSSSMFTYSTLRQADVEAIVERAFTAAYELIEPLIGANILKRSKYKTMRNLSKFTIKYFETLKLRIPASQPQQLFSDTSEESDNEDEEESDNEDEEESDNEDEEESDNEDEEESESDNEDDEEEEEGLPHVLLDSSDASFKGMRVKESINPTQSNSFFKVRRENDTADVYIHKQTACWVLTNEKFSLSSDRVKRVTQTK